MRTTPKKIEYNDKKFEKIKCGSYQTIALDKDGIVYCWGRGGLNLEKDLNKHTLNPVSVKIYRENTTSNIKCISIKANYGNCYVVLLSRIILMKYNFK